MTTFDVWNADRSEKCRITASSWQEFLSLGCATLKLPVTSNDYSRCRVVDKCHGVSVFDYETLVKLVSYPKACEFQLLCPGEEWIATNDTERRCQECGGGMQDLTPKKCLWLKLFGDKNMSFSPAEYYKINALVETPSISGEDLEEGYMAKTLPYLVQRIKMRGCRVLLANRLEELMKRFQVDGDSYAELWPEQNVLADINENQVPLSRIDCITGLMNVVDKTVASDLLTTMAQFPMALPLVVQNLKFDGHTILTSLLRGIMVKWEVDRVIENSLFIDPYQLLLAVRVGDNSQGKSTILNQLFSKPYMFSSKNEPGTNVVKPHTLDGCAEFVWLLQETCNDSFWKAVMSRFYSSGNNEIYLLANLHGNVVEHMETFSEISRMNCKVLAFRMSNCSDSDWKIFADSFNSSDSMSVIYVDSSNYSRQRTDMISTQDLLNDFTVGKVRQIIGHAIGRLSCCAKYAGRPTDENRLEKLRRVPNIETHHSRMIVDFTTINSCKLTKDALCTSTNFSRSDDSVTITISTPMNNLLSQFAGILLSDPRDRELALFNLEKELFRLSNSESQLARAEISNLKKAIQKHFFGQRGKNEDEMAQLRKDLTRATDEVDTTNFGLEHLYRILGKLHASNFTFNTRVAVKQLPAKIAELIASGHSVELINGDECDMPVPWLSDIFSHVDRLFPGLKVFVVSVIGLQSSGKSTLLNSLFACRFSVSVGRCSRGLFMKLLFLDKTLPQARRFDAILLIDTEGLGSPEKMNDPQADKKDRLLATFAIGISNLTIINVLGENMKELTEILQIAIVTMARLEKVDIAPDILLIQHLLTEKNSEKTSQAEEQFCTAIKNAVELTDKMDVQVGVRDSTCLSVLYDRIHDGTLLMQFHPYKDGATVNSPPSDSYHDDVCNLYQRILECGQQSNNIIEFKKWHTLVECYWDNVAQEDFALHFKNVREVYDFIERGKKIEDVKQAISSAFQFHALALKELIFTETKQRITGDSKRDFRSSFEHNVTQQLNQIPSRCPQSTECEKCQAARDLKSQLFDFVAGKAYENEVADTILRYERNIFQLTLKKQMQIFDGSTVKEGCSIKFDEEIRRNLLHILSQKHKGVNQADETNLLEASETIFAKLEEVAVTMDDCTDTVRAKFLRELKETYHSWSDFCSRFEQVEICVEDMLLAESSETGIGIVKLMRAYWQDFKRLIISDERKKAAAQDLTKRLKDIPNDVLQQKNADSFEHGLISTVMQKVTGALDNFAKRTVKLTPKNKMDLHIGVQQLLFKRIEVLQNEWERCNRPSSILRQNKGHYMDEIQTRLRFGFTSESEGRVIAQHLRKAIKQKIFNAEKAFRINAVKDLVWITNSEKVRLKYFSYVASQVDRGRKDTALRHFVNPQQAIEYWFRSEVDGYRSQASRKSSTDIWRDECEFLVGKLKQCTMLSDITKLVGSYEANTTTLTYKLTKKSLDGTQESFAILKKTILENVQQQDPSCRPTDLSVNIKPSDDAEVMDRLGCTAQCHWCGALCWGQRGHDQNTDDTRKHHSSHQPQGLARVHYKHSKHLVAAPCHSIADEAIVHFGEFSETGLSWKKAKEEYFNDWKFDRHYNVKFDELMRWFFQQLHEDIARNSKTVLPAEQNELSKHKCTSLKLSAIMSRIEKEVS